VPQFLNKLYNMVSDPSTSSLIKWSPTGLSFLVTRQEDFARDVLPRFFKHNNFSSFVRQLNMYGFHKVPHLTQGVLAGSGSGGEVFEFSNQNFQRGRPDLLALVTRKKGNPATTAAQAGTLTAPTSTSNTDTNNLDLTLLLDELRTIKQTQSQITSDLSRLQTDSALLWSEQMASRARHERHQETIDKILRFLASVYG
ncbi:hypothetical protein SAICODRAFT_38543, partial [Saitoella complicata NRRL Y-17804]